MYQTTQQFSPQLRHYITDLKPGPKLKLWETVILHKLHTQMSLVDSSVQVNKPDVTVGVIRKRGPNTEVVRNSHLTRTMHPEGRKTLDLKVTKIVLTN